MLKEVFGDRLGTGDYGHLTIEHTAMLFRRFRSFTKYSNQGFEALHRMQRQVYTRATNHDARSPGKSSKAEFDTHNIALAMHYLKNIFSIINIYILVLYIFYAFVFLVEDILLHHYAEKLLFFRVCIDKAIDCYMKGKYTIFIFK